MTGTLAQRVSPARQHPARGRDLSDIVRAWALATPSRIAIIDDDRSWTWAELVSRVDELAAGLSARGLTAGDAVAVAESPNADMVALYLATAHTGTVLVPLNTRMRAAELTHVLHVARPALTLCAAEYAQLVTHAGGDAVVSTPEFSWADQLASPGEITSASAGFDTPHLLLFTSGTTGVPKAALLSQRRSMGDAAAAALASGVRHDDRLLGYQPLYHTGGWDFLKQYLLVGGSVVLMRSFNADRAVQLIEQHHCTSIFAVPLVLLGMMESPSFAAADLSSFRRLMYASYEPTDLILRAVAAFEARGAREISLEHVYGQTEAGSFIATLRGADVTPDALDSVGKPVPGVTLGLLDDNLVPVPLGEQGEICVRSETVMIGYVDDAAATDATFRGGWLHTGDLGRQDANGLLRITGRLKDMIRTAGENVFPKEVETVLVGHPLVADCAVFGIPDERYDERVCAVVAPVAGAVPTTEELIAYLKERLAGYKVPRLIAVVDAIPKTPAGKTARQQLRPLVDGSSGRRH